MSNWFENQSQRTQISTVTSAPFIQTRIERPPVLIATASFRSIFFNSCNTHVNDQAFLSLQGCSDDKNCLCFPPFSSRFVDFAVEFCFRSKFSSLGKRIDGVIFLDQSHFFATNSSQWDCFILYRRYIAANGYFRFCQSGQMPAFELRWKILKQKKRFICISLFRYCNK